MFNLKYLVLFDGGHGLNTEGKRTPLFPDGTFMRENEFNRSVIRKADNLLEKFENIDVFFTVTEKTDISLEERVKRANDIYDKYKDLYNKIVLVSFHANALTGSWGTQNGTATFYYPANMVDKAFAEVIQKNLISKTRLKPHRGGVVDGNFAIIRDVKMTACLCECAFMDNLEEAKLLLTDEFRQACAEGIVNGLLEYFGEGEKRVEVNYKAYKDGTKELRGNVEDFGVKIVDKSNRSIKEPFCVNGTFFWHDAKGVTYPTSILFDNDKVYKGQANHLPYPQSVFIVNKDNTVEMKLIKNLNELDLSKVRLAVGGVGLRNSLNKNFKYNPKGEGFTGAFADVLGKRNKTVIGYNRTNNKIYLLARENITHGDLIKLISNNSSGEAYDIALSLDGGGSTFFNNANEMLIFGDNRRINNILGFML